jgi:hypothetical protein
MAMNKGHAMANAIARMHSKPKKNGKSLREAFKDAESEGESVEHELSESKEFEAGEKEGAGSGPTKDDRKSGKVKEKKGSRFKGFDPAERPLQPERNAMGQQVNASRLEKKQTASDVKREAYGKGKK